MTCAVLGATMGKQLLKADELGVVPNFDDLFFANPCLASLGDSRYETELGLSDPES